MIGTDANGVCGTQKERATAFKTKNHSGEFFIMGIVVPFGW